MKKLVSPKMQFLLILTLVLTFLIFNNNNKNNITYLSLGDGYAKGKDSYGINDYGYSDYLKDNLEKNNYLKNYINEYSENDMTISKLINYISNSEENVLKTHKMSLKECLQEADLLTLSIGINDFKYAFAVLDNLDYQKMNEEIENVEINFNHLINVLKKYYKYDIYVIGYPNNNLESYYLSMAIRRFNNFLATNDRIVYISASELENKNNIFLNPNSNYYNKEGHKIIANKIYKEYRSSHN